MRRGPSKSQPRGPSNTSLDLHAAFDALPAGLYIVDRALGVVVWNHVREEGPQGIPRERALGHHLQAVLRAQGFESARVAIERVFTTGRPYEGMEETREGARFFLTRRLPITNGPNVTHVLSLFEEVTERRQAQEALEQQRTFLRQVIDLSPNFIFAKDRDGRFTLANEAVAQIYGTTVEELVGKTDADFNPNVEEVESFRQHDLEVMDSLQEKLVSEEVITDAKGAKRWLQTVKRPIVGPDGLAQQVLGVSTDITDHKRMEDQLRQALRLEAVGRLAGGIAHDFNNLLTVIMGCSDILIRRFGPDDPSRDKVEQIYKSGERAAALTRQLLAFSRKQVLQSKVIDLNVIVSDMGAMLRRLIGEDIGLVTVVTEGLGSVKADPGQIEQVLVNLAVNARDAMLEGGRLTIETANVELDEAYAQDHAGFRPGRYVMLAVTDTGRGMDAEVQEHMFEPFFTTKEPGKGTGLGLATVYGIVTQSGGYIWVYSEPGHGTTFKIYLPRVDESSPAAHAEQVARVPKGTETILVVEDEEALREITREILTGQGYTVIEAPSGAAALKLAEQHTGPIHLLLTDVVMPGMSGRELAQNLAARQPAMKLLFMSGYTDDAIVRHGVLEEGTAFIQKPFTLASLTTRVRDVLDSGL